MQSCPRILGFTSTALRQVYRHCAFLYRHLDSELFNRHRDTFITPNQGVEIEDRPQIENSASLYLPPWWLVRCGH